jgi:drug/metabolite transporter (DMT)-like permease
MSSETGYAVAALVLYGLADFVFKRAAAAGVKAHQFLMVQAWFFSSLTFAYALATHMLVPVPAALWGGLAGLFVFVAFYNFARSLAAGSVSINAPIFRLNFVVTAVLAVALLGEALTAMKALGLALALAAVWLLLGEGGAPSGESKNVNRRSLVQVLTATIALGLANFFHKIGLMHGAPPATMLCGQAAVFVSLATAFAGVADRGIRPLPATWRYSPLAAVLLVGAFLLLLRSLVHGEASVLVPIAQMGFIVTAALGVAVLHESITLRKSAGLAAALGALAVLAAA